VTTPRAVRYRCELSSLVSVTAHELVQTRVLELSENGAFVEAVGPLRDLDPGTDLQVGLALPGGDPWTSLARVQRHGTTRHELRAQGLDHVTVLSRGLGVEFQELDDEALERLRDFLELLDGR
jgi:hypothetical protein